METHHRPAEVEQVADEVLIDGPDGAVSSFTPEAALQTANRIEQAAVDALLARPWVEADEGRAR